MGYIHFWCLLSMGMLGMAFYRSLFDGLFLMVIGSLERELFISFHVIWFKDHELGI